MDEKQKILSFIKSSTLGVISTIDSMEIKPESAVVAFSETDNLEIIFGSFSNTRKNLNIEKNNRISFVIGWDDEEDITVQYEGITQKLKGKEKRRSNRYTFTKKS